MDVATSLMISLRISLIATAFSFLAGLPLAWALSRPGWRGRNLVEIAVNLPLALPPTVAGYYLLQLIGREGPVGQITRALWGRTLLFSPAAAVLASTVICLPLVVQTARSALEEIAPEVCEAAQIDGAGPWESFRHIALPLAWRGVWTGVLLAYARSLGEFGATLMVAGNIPGKTQTLALATYAAVQAGHESTAHILALILTGVAALSMGLGLRLRRPGWTERAPLSAASRQGGRSPWPLQCGLLTGGRVRRLLAVLRTVVSSA